MTSPISSGFGIASYLTGLTNGLISSVTNGSSTALTGGDALADEPSSPLSFLAQLPQRAFDGAVRYWLERGDRSFHERAQGLNFADRIPIAYRGLMSVLGEEHVAYNLLGLVTTGFYTALALSHYASIVGGENFLENYHAARHSKDRLPVHPEFIEYGRLHFAHWIENYAKTHRLNVRFENAELIPRTGPVVYALFCHSSIYPDFFLPYLDHKAAYVADAYNFRDNSISAAIGFGLMGDMMGQPLVDRKDLERSKLLLNQIVENGVKYGLRAAWFPNGGRVPRAYRDHGGLSRAGFYSNVPDPSKPRTYLQSGFAAMNAAKLAERTGQTVRIVVMTMDGPERVMPKMVKDPPFIQKDRVGENVTYRVVEVIDVVPGNDKRNTATVGRSLHLKAKEALDIDNYLEGRVETWGRRRFYADMGRRFREKADKDEGFFIVADRIRSIPPQIPDRRQFIERLLDLVALMDPKPKELLDKLIADVTESLLKYQYYRPVKP